MPKQLVVFGVFTKNNLIYLCSCKLFQYIIVHKTFLWIQFPPENFTVMLFHYDGIVDDWKMFPWYGRVIHVAAVNQTKWYGYLCANLVNLWKIKYPYPLFHCFNLWLERLIRWFAKRFLHPDIVAAYKYIFLWDEDIGVDNFDPIRYINIPNCIVSMLEVVLG